MPSESILGADRLRRIKERYTGIWQTKINDENSNEVNQFTAMVNVGRSKMASWASFQDAAILN